MIPRVLPLLFLLFSFSLPVSAQRDPALPHLSAIAGGSVSLSGSVRSVDDRPVRDVRVEVRDFGSGQTVASGYTLPNGSFEFSDVPRGSYEIVATSGIQEARERVDLYQPQAFMVVRLPHSNGTDPSGASTVSVAQLKVPEKAAKAYAKANEAFTKNKRDEALSQVAKALQIFPKYAQALTLRGLLYIEDGQASQALEPLEQATSYDYSYGMGFVVLGAAYNLLSRYDDAVRSLQHAVALLPTSWQAQFEMAKAELGKGQFQEALRHVDRAGQLAPSEFSAVHLVRAHALLGLKNYSVAITELEQYLGAQPKGATSTEARKMLDRARAFAAATPGK